MNSPTEDIVINALSFDIEDWFHIVGITGLEDSSKWSQLPSIVENYTEQLLELLDEAGVKATFFILGWIADKYPQLVKRISKNGHEIGTHSFWHKRVDKLTVKQFSEDIKRSVCVLEDHTGIKILGFRAPSFSIRPGTEWAYDVLIDQGLKYDSSLFPATRGHGGYPCENRPHEFRNAPSGRPFLVLPITVIAIGPFRLPFSGGGYIRLLPTTIIRFGFNKVNRSGLPVVVYLHPRDFAVDAPKATMPLYRRFKSYVGLGTTKGKLQMLLRCYRFDTCAKVLASYGLGDTRG